MFWQKIVQILPIDFQDGTSQDEINITIFSIDVVEDFITKLWTGLYMAWGMMPFDFESLMSPTIVYVLPLPVWPYAKIVPL